MKIRTIILALCCAGVAGVVNAGPVVDDVSAHDPDADKAAVFGESALTDSHALDATSLPDTLQDALREKSAAAVFDDPGSVVYGGSALENSTVAVTMPTAAGISEPATLALLGAGLIGIAMLRRRR